MGWTRATHIIGCGMRIRVGAGREACGTEKRAVGILFQDPECCLGLQLQGEDLALQEVEVDPRIRQVK